MDDEKTIRNEWLLGLLFSSIGLLLCIAILADSQSLNPHFKWYITVLIFWSGLAIHIFGCYVLANMLSHFLTEERGGEKER